MNLFKPGRFHVWVCLNGQINKLWIKLRPLEVYAGTLEQLKARVRLIHRSAKGFYYKPADNEAEELRRFDFGTGEDSESLELWL